MSTQNIAQRKSPKAILAAAILCLLGILLYGLSYTVADHSSSLYMTCSVGGIALLIVGILKIAFGGKESVYRPTNSSVRSYTIYFESLASDALVTLIEQGKFDDIRAARRKESGPVRLDVQRSQDDRYVALQVLQYVPYSYETVSEMYHFPEEKAPEVAACVGNPTK